MNACRSNLLESQLGFSVRRLKQRGCPEVRQLAGRLIDKWRALIKGGKHLRAKEPNKPFSCRDKVLKMAIKQTSSCAASSSRANQGWQDIPADSQCTNALPLRNSFVICKPTDINFSGFEI